MNISNRLSFVYKGAATQRHDAVAAPLAMARPRQRLRDQFPFLSELDCPVELQAMVTLRVTRWHEYHDLYGRLRDCRTAEECADTACRLLEAYLDNRAMTRELEHYGRHRRVLGEHPLFGHFRELTKLRSRTTAQLFQERKRTIDNIWRADSEIRKGTKPHLDGVRRRRIEGYRLKLAEIERLLGMPNE